MTSPSLHRLTDVMVMVRSTTLAVRFWTEAIGLVAEDGGGGWTLLRDPQSGQRLVLTAEDFGSAWALAIETDELEAALQRIVDGGGTLRSRRGVAAGFEYALCNDPEGIPILIFGA